MKTLTHRIRHCHTLAEQAASRIDRSYVFARLPPEARSAFLEATRCLARAAELFDVVADYVLAEAE